MRIIISFALIVIFAIISCDPGSTIKYEIYNNTNRPIRINYQFVSGISSDTSIQSTIIEPYKNKTINEEMHLGSADYIDKSRDSILMYLMSIKQDSSLTTINFKDKNLWKYNVKEKYLGIYQLKVEQDFFIK